MRASICLLCALVIAVHVYAADATKEGAVREATLLDSCVPDQCPVFYIRALSRTFPIPSRYMLAPVSKEESPSLRFTSPVPDLSNIDALVAGRELNGTIVLEPRTMLDKAVTSGELKLKLLKKIDGVEVHAVSIPPSSPLCCFQTDFVALVGADDYLMISDDNKRLPELLLRISQRVKQQAEARNQRMQR
jgi:hypothetical protein